MTDKDKTLVNKYLLRHYPIIKIKYGRRFKRGVTLIKTIKGKTYINKELLKSEEGAKKIREHILNDISVVFGFEQS